MTLIEEITDTTVERIADIILGKNKFTAKEIIFMALSRAMEDAYARGIVAGRLQVK